MTNPTSNFGWQMPTPTDLVTDLPADFEVFGQAVDTSLADLKGGTTGQVLKKNTNADMDFVWSADAAGMTNPMTTTGDTIYSSPGSTPVRLGIGSTGNVLTVAGGVPTWAAPAGAGANWSELNPGGTSLSGSSTTISGISGKDKIMILIIGGSLTGSGYIAFRVNGVTNSYFNTTSQHNFAASYASTNFGSDGSTGASRVDFLSNSAAANTANAYVMFSGCNSTGVKPFNGVGSNENGGIHRSFGGFWNSTSTITEVNIITGGTFDGGSVYVLTSA